jgi:hypothetical protein
MAEALTPTEDEQLRRLHALAEFGQLVEPADMLDELLQRDRRTSVRPPRVVAVPVQREPRDAQPWVST